MKMSETEAQIKSSLQNLDLTENESKIIIGMVKIGADTDASTIAKISHVPRTKVYAILQKLAEQNLIESLIVEGA